MLVLVLFLILLVLWHLLLTTRKEDPHRNLPPAPPGRLPLIGHLWRLHPTKPFLNLDQWSRQLGDVFSVFFGGERVIVISRERLLKEAFLKDGDNFSGRPSLFVHESCWGRGQVISDGASNAEVRRFLMAQLKLRKGVDGQGVEGVLAEEVTEMINGLQRKVSNGEREIDMDTSVFFVVGNVLSWLVTGRRHAHDSVDFRTSTRWLEKTEKMMEKTVALTFLPWLRFFPICGSAYWAMKEQAQAVNELMQRDIQDRVDSQSYRRPEAVDITSAFLRRVEQDGIIFNRDLLARIMTEMFFAGIQSECSTFAWAFLLLIEYPEVQERCRAEIRSEFGTETAVTWKDRHLLPYLGATIREVQRYGNIAPFALFHRNFRETKLDGYVIPANSMILLNLYSTMRDPSIFPDPDKFNPSRFLDDRGQLISEHSAGFYPYGVGPRVCMGENIARTELLLVLAAVLQRFRLRKIPGHRYSLEQKMELTLHPDKYRVLLELI